MDKRKHPQRLKQKPGQQKPSQRNTGQRNTGQRNTGQRNTGQKQTSQNKGGLVEPVGLRIIGGTFGGRRLQYHGDRTVRPMKDRVREALFNLLGPEVKGTHAVDLFAGTGALGLEALSRGASYATFVDRHWPSVRILKDNVALLGLEQRCEIAVADTFYWWDHQRTFEQQPVLLFCAPPYALFNTQGSELLRVVAQTQDSAPEGSLIAVESDTSFALTSLPDFPNWRIRAYPPAQIAVYRVEGHTEPDRDENRPVSTKFVAG